MTQSTSTELRRWLALGALLALGAWLFFGTDVLSPAARDADGDRGTRIENADMLGVGETDTPTSHGELVGDPTAAARRARDGVRHGPVTVTVLGPNKVPLPQVFVILAETDSESRQVSLRDTRTDSESRQVSLRDACTDVAGRAHFADVLYDGSARVLLARQLAPTGSGVFFVGVGSGDINIFEELKGHGLETVCATTITGESVTLRSPVGLPIDVQAVDAATGRRLHGLKGGIWPAFGGLDGRVAPVGAPVAVGRGMACRYLIALAPPPGYMLASPVQVSRPIHPDVKRATHVVALHREADIVLVAKQGATLPSLVDSSLQLGLGQQYRRAQFLEADGFGRVVVQGVRFVPHVPVHVYWAFPGGKIATGEGHFGATHEGGLVIELGLHSVDADSLASEEIEESFETDNDLEHVESSGADGGSAGPAPVRVILDLKRPDGAPATLAVVEFGKLKTSIQPGDKGQRDWSVLPGEHEVVVWGAGADLRATIEVSPDATQTVHLRGTEGGRLRVSVKDKHGNQLAHARVTIVGPMQWAQSDVKDGHQRLDALTNAQGERTFHRVAVGRCRVTLRYGGFYRTKTVEIREGRTTKLDYVMDLSR